MKRLLLTAALVLAPALAHAEPAQEHYSAGRHSYRAGLYGRALEEFERSYAVSPSPNTNLYIARSLRELGRLAEAREHYRATIREAGERGAKYGAARDAAESELHDVEVRLERAEPPSAPVTTPSAAALAPAPAPAPGPARASVPAPALPERSPSAVTWATGGVAVVGLASFGVLYGLASDRYAYLEDHCTRTRDTACDDARSVGRTQESAAYVALGVGVVAAAVAIVSFVVAPDDDGNPRASRSWPLAF